MKIKTNEIIYREDLYPRFKPNQATIQKYSDSVEYLPPIKLNQNKILIDGFHRWKAFMLAGHTEIPYEEVHTESEKELKKLAYQLNSNHGLQLSVDEKRRFAIDMIGDMRVEDIAKILGLNISRVNELTRDKREDLKQQRDRKIVDLYLKAYNTQQTISDILGVDQATIARIIDNMQNTIIGKMHKDFKPYLYNIWNLQKQDNDRKYFGAFPEVFMENLLYYHTEPLDIVFDPFGGGGTTIDVCKSMFRRYYVSDRVVTPGRENEILQHDINNGLPENLPKPKLAFIDPPYWRQAEGKYSQDAEDLGNMSLDDFNESMLCLFNSLSERGVKYIAVVIQPTQYKNGFDWVDHIFYFNEMLSDYKICMRYILPYSTEQYKPQVINKAKERNECLSLNRDLVVWKIK